MAKMNKIGSSGLARNFVSMALLQAGNFLVPILTLPYLSRTLGVTGFGIYSFSLAVMAALGVIVEWGFPLNATANVAKHRDNAELLVSLLNSTVAAKLILVLSCAAVLVILCSFAPPFYNATYVLASAFGLVLAYSLNLGWYLQGLERMSLFAVSSLCARLTTIPLILAFVHGPSQAWLAALIQSGAALLGAALSMVLLAHSGLLIVKRTTLKEVRGRLGEARHFFLASAAINIYTASTVIIVGITCDPRTLAIYAGADRIKSAAQNVLAPLSQVFYPRVVHLFEIKSDRAEVMIQNLFWLFGGIGLTVTLTLESFSGLVVHLLLGDRFVEAGQVLRILAPIPMISALSNVLSVQAMVPLGLATARSQILVAVTFLSFPSTLLLSWLFGAYGAAGVVLMCEMIGLVLFFVVVQRHFPVLRLPIRT